MKESRKVELLRQIRYVLEREENPTPRAAGLMLHELKELEKLLDLRVVDDSVDKLGNYRIHGLSNAGFALLAQADGVAAGGPPPVRGHFNSERQPVPSSIGRRVGKGIWNLVLIGVGVVIGWYLRKYYG